LNANDIREGRVAPHKTHTQRTPHYKPNIRQDKAKAEAEEGEEAEAEVDVKIEVEVEVDAKAKAT
jgi:hypothetical protein